LHFNELIPASMLGEPLPLNLWPNLWKAIDPDAETSFAADPTPVQLLVEALGLKCPGPPPAPQNPDRGSHSSAAVPMLGALSIRSRPPD
jgi:hypothetical protein